MHNNIMAAGSRDRPPMLATGRYAQWRSRFLRYIDTRPNGDALRKCILKAKNKKCGKPSKGYNKGGILYIQDVKTKLNWEFCQFTSQDGETIESYYTRFYKMMNEMIKNNLTVATMQVNITKGKKIAKPITTPPSESDSKEDSDPEQARGIKTMQKKYLALIAKNAKTVKTLQRINKKRCCCVNKLRKVYNLSRAQSNQLQTRMKKLLKQELEAHYSYMAKIQEVLNADSGTDSEPLEQVQYDTNDNVSANDIQHFEHSESISNTCAVETGDSHVIPNSLDMCDNDIQDDQNDVECDDERVALANLIANLKLDVDENKKIQNQIKESKCNIDSRIN
ncbi:hypothetical protein Tco_1224160 [Tanacetum coccineum]